MRRAVILTVMMLAVGVGAARAQTAPDDKLKEAQRVLLMLGLSTAKPDGVMNTHTERALGDFQRVSGLPVTNKLDPATLEALRAKRDSKFSTELRVPTAAEKKAAAAAAREPLPAPAAVGPAQKVEAGPASGGKDILTTRSLGSLPTLSAPQVSFPTVAPRAGSATPPPAIGRSGSTGLSTGASTGPAPLLASGPLTLPPGATAPLPVTRSEEPAPEEDQGPSVLWVVLAWVGIPSGLFGIVWLGWPLFGRRLEGDLSLPTVSAGLADRAEPAFSGAIMTGPSDSAIYDY